MKKESTKVFEDNSACIAQLEKVISRVTRQSIFPNIFLIHSRALEKSISGHRICSSCNNPTNLFIKTIHTITFRNTSTITKCVICVTYE